MSQVLYKKTIILIKIGTSNEITQEHKHCYLQENGSTTFFDCYVFESGINRQQSVLDKCCQVFVRPIYRL